MEVCLFKHSMFDSGANVEIDSNVRAWGKNEEVEGPRRNLWYK